MPRASRSAPNSLRIAENAPLILPLHGELDRARERARQGDNRGTGRLGTTGRGIGPAYEDKVARRAIRVCDLADPGLLAAKVDELLVHHNALRQAFGETLVDAAALVASLNALAPRLLPLRRAALAAPCRAAPARRPHPVRGRAGGDAGCRPRHLPVRHLVQHAGRGGRARRRHRARGRGLRARHHQGLHDAGRRGPVSRPSSTTRSAGASASAAASSARSPAARGAAAGSTPCSCARRSRSAASAASR